MRVEANAAMAVGVAEVYAVPADLRNLPAWWIEHLSAEINTPSARLRDATYTVRYRFPWGLITTATCAVVAARPQRSLTYSWEGAGLRLAIGQTFVPVSEGTQVRLVADVALAPLLLPAGPVLQRLLRPRLEEELTVALVTLGDLAQARTAMRRGGRRSGTAATWPGPATASAGAENR